MGLSVCLEGDCLSLLTGGTSFWDSSGAALSDGLSPFKTSSPLISPADFFSSRALAGDFFASATVSFTVFDFAGDFDILLFSFLASSVASAGCKKKSLKKHPKGLVSASTSGQ